MALIRIQGATATLSATPLPPATHLAKVLRVKHPGARFNRAYRDGRWDGYVSLATANRFPAGFAYRVARHLREEGVSEVRIKAQGGKPLDASVVDEDYLRGIRLWPHQLGAIRAALANPRGILEEPTGSGKTAMIAAIARVGWEQRGLRCLVVVPKKGLAHQTREEFERFYGDEITVGIAGDGHREEGSITIATAQTLINFQDRMRKKGRKKELVEGDPWLRELIESAGMLIFDECHRTSSKSWQEIAEACPAQRRYGFSGTPITNVEWDDLRLEGATGPCIHRTDPASLIEKGLSARPRIVMLMSDEVSGPELVHEIPSPKKGRKPRSRPVDYPTAYQLGVVANDKHNEAIVASARWMAERGRRVVVLCRRKEHFARLAELFEQHRVRFAALSGDSPSDERAHAKNDFREGEIDVLLATTIFDEGEDLKGVGGLVLAEGVKALTSNLQRIGRGMRRDTEDLWVVDVVPTCHPTLTAHALQRCTDYERVGYDVQVQEDWPRRLPRRLPEDLLPFERWEEALRACSA
tara:strand:- start:4646 stop:6223 length:1578 start_codon:yes stop_codon:yes gene_type:complete